MFEYHSDMGHCFYEVVSKKKSKKKKKKKFFFFTFLTVIGKIRHGIGKKRWLFSIGNGAEIQPLEMGRMSPEF